VGGLVTVLSVTERQRYLDVSQQIPQISCPELIMETETTMSVEFSLVRSKANAPAE
jgi:hypothetical protein